MLKRSALQRICALLCLFLVAGCAQQQVAKYSGRSAIEQHQQLLRGTSLFSVEEPLPILDPVELLAVNDDMRAFLDKHIPSRATSDQAKARLILKGLLDDGLQLHYNNLKTYTAEEAFYAREGNCMSFTNLYMALAREAGLIVMFQEVEVGDAWSAVGDTHYYSLHINVLVDLPRKQQIVDFHTQADSFSWRSRVVGDKTAAAQYYNNMAVHHLSEGNLQQAFLHSHKAIDLRPNTGYFWANLGTILKRADDLDGAEEAYHVAIDMSGEPAAVSNLARLYTQRGQTELAAHYTAKAEGYRMKNPYYLFDLAQRSYEAGNYSESIELLTTAIKTEKKEHQFHHLRGLSWARLGDAQAAKTNFSRAAKLAGDQRSLNLYEHKLNLLADRE